jgi:flotillin
METFHLLLAQYSRSGDNPGNQMMLILVVSMVVIMLGMTIFFFSRYKKCPADKILVIYGKTSGGQSSKCMHGGAAFIWPVLQAYELLDLTPIRLEINAKHKLTDGSTIKPPVKCTVGISTDSGVMDNAAERLSGLDSEEITNLAKDIIESSINRIVDRTESISNNTQKVTFIESIEVRIQKELSVIGLRVISFDLRLQLNDS